MFTNWFWPCLLISYVPLIVSSANKQQVLLFVHTRKDTAATARALRDLAQTNDTLHKILREDSGSRSVLQDQAELVSIKYCN